MASLFPWHIIIKMEINHKQDELNRNLLLNLDLFSLPKDYKLKWARYIFELACDVQILQCEICDLTCASIFF
jgi:hypothetical protein